MSITHHSTITALVAGGAGFVGSHLCRRLLSDGKQVVCIDNLHTGSLNNIRELMDDSRFSFIEHDIVNPLPQFGHIDEIYNLACPASPHHYQADPTQTFLTCTVGTYHLLELARANDCPLLQASTSEVYGCATQSLQSEDYWGYVNPVGKRSCYDEGKRGAETLCMDHHRQYGTRVKIIRIFNTYGPRMSVDDGRVVSNFIVSALRGEPLTIYGDGRQTRSFMYVSDLIDAISLMMETNDSVTGPVNIGNPDERSIDELAGITLRLTGSASSTVHHPLPADDPPRCRPDITLAQTLLGWQPRVLLHDGFLQTIDYFRRVTEKK